MNEKSESGCPGKYLRVSNRSAGICYSCERYGKPGEQIEPAAEMDASGTWGCTRMVSIGQPSARLLDGDEGA